MRKTGDGVGGRGRVYEAERGRGGRKCVVVVVVEGKREGNRRG